MIMKVRNIFLIGFMGTGKTTVSEKLSSQLGFSELDMDREIEKRQQKKISEIFAEGGEEAFRELETALLREFSQTSDCVVSCGGGVVLRKKNVRSMKENGIIVLLTAEPETVYERVHSGTDRPLLNGNMNVGYIRELMGKRSDIYREAADITVKTDGKSPESITEEIVGKIKQMK